MHRQSFRRCSSDDSAPSRSLYTNRPRSNGRSARSKSVIASRRVVRESNRLFAGRDRFRLDTDSPLAPTQPPQPITKLLFPRMPSHFLLTQFDGESRVIFNGGSRSPGLQKTLSASRSKTGSWQLPLQIFYTAIGALIDGCGL